MQPPLEEMLLFYSELSEVGCAIIVFSFEGEIEAQRGEATCSKSHSCLGL